MSTPRKQVTLKSLQGYHSIQNRGKKQPEMTTLGLQDLLPEEDKVKLRKHEERKQDEQHKAL